MSQKHNCPCSEFCVLQKTLAMIGGKWKMRILCSLLRNGASRYNELLRNIEGMSNTMLSHSLKELERDQLVQRTEYLEVPIRVVYDLSDKARRLQPILEKLILWYLEENGYEYIISQKTQSGKFPETRKQGF